MNTKTGLQSTVLRREALTAEQRDAMFALLDRHFTCVTRAQFGRDLDEKNWVLLLANHGQLAGFSTLAVYETRFESEPVSVVCSGDTIVAAEAWGTMTLPRTWISAVNLLRATVPRGRYYWLLLTSGFRTYRFLPVFWREFFPRYDHPTPPESLSLLTHLATERFGVQFDPAAGLVRFTQPQRLREQLQNVPRGRLADPHVDFFLQRNPGWSQGDELVCLAELTAENLTAAGRRMVTPSPRELSCIHC